MRTHRRAAACRTLCRTWWRGAGFAVVTEEALHTADLHALAAWIDAPAGMVGLSVHPADAARRRTRAQSRRRAVCCKTLGNVTFLERPFHPTTLVSLAQSALRGRRRQYEARARLESLRRTQRDAGSPGLPRRLRSRKSSPTSSRPRCVRAGAWPRLSLDRDQPRERQPVRARLRRAADESATACPTCWRTCRRT